MALSALASQARANQGSANRHPFVPRKFYRKSVVPKHFGEMIKP